MKNYPACTEITLKIGLALKFRSNQFKGITEGFFLKIRFEKKQSTT